MQLSETAATRDHNSVLRLFRNVVEYPWMICQLPDVTRAERRARRARPASPIPGAAIYRSHGASKRHTNDPCRAVWGQPGGPQTASLLALLKEDCPTAPQTIKPSTWGSQSAWKRRSSVATRSPWSSSKLIRDVFPDRCKHLGSAGLLAEATNSGRFARSALVCRGN